MKKLRQGLSSIKSYADLIWQMLEIARRAHPLSFFSLLVLDALQGLTPLATAYISKNLFDDLAHIFQGTPFASLLPGLILLLLAQMIVVIVDQLLSPIREYCQTELSRQITLSMRSALYEKLNSLKGLAFFEDPQFQNTLQTTSSHVQFAPAQALQFFTTFIRGMISLTSFLGVLIVLSPLLAGLLFVAMIPHLLVHIKLSKQQVQTYFESSPQERRASYYGQVLSWVQFAKEVRLFQLGDYFLHRFRQSLGQVQAKQRRFQLLELRWQTVLALVTGLVSTGAFILVVLQAFSGRISLGDLVFYVQATENIQSTLMGLIFSISRLREDLLIFQSFHDILALEDRIAVHTPTHPVPPLSRGITFRKVSFRYSEDHPWIIRHLDLELPAGQTLALVGLNGAGKTTLVKLLTRLYDPTEGEILWDERDIRDFDPDEYRSHLGSVFQDFARYEVSVQENIGLGKTAEVDNLPAIEEAAIKAGVHGKITTLPNGYQTMLTRWMLEEEDGTGIDLSGGEWQKLAIARMFLRDADMLILDEPTASLDAQAEYEIFRRFHELVQGNTCLLITHRFSTVRMAHRIAVLEDGQISEVGTHQELFLQEGTYAKLYNMQAEILQGNPVSLKE